jgi:hypothetical protein
MKRFNFVAIVCSLAFTALVVAPKIRADDFNKKTTITFTEPFEVPGAGAQVLPAGTYVFKIMDSPNDREIVQIFSADELHLYTTILAIPNVRLKATDKTVLTFGERGAGQPEAIKAWFYPGQQWGQEFVYPKKRAVELAKILNEPVLAMPIEVTDTVPVEELKTVPVAAVQPTGEEVPVTAVVDTPPVAVMAQAEPQAQPPAEPLAHEQTLPKTASSLPLFALVGMLSLFAGFTLLIVTKRSA